jgi:hypothetical protein
MTPYNPLLNPLFQKWSKTPNRIFPISSEEKWSKIFAIWEKNHIKSFFI